LNEVGVKATFYVSLPALERRLDEWKQVLADGHEIGNHTVNHPCSANFRFSRARGLEDYTLEEMEEELTGANERLEELIGNRPTTFAYPCGQTFVGRGVECESYVPLVARHFRVGRGFKAESPNNPLCMDLAQAMGMDFDRARFSDVKELIDRAIDDCAWLILAGHEVGVGGRQCVNADTLRSVCEHAVDPASDLWIDTTSAIGECVRSGI